MKDTQDIQEALEARQTEVHDQEDKMEKQEQRENKLGAPPTIQQSSVHFFPETRGSDATTLPLSQSLSHEMPPSYCRSTSKISELTTPTTGLLASTSAVSSSQTQKILDIRCLIVSKKQTLLGLDPEPPMIGEGEDYFLSLFGNSKKLPAHSSNTEKICKHFSMILEEVGQSTSSSLGDIKIAEVNVKGLYIKLINSSLDKEMEIGNHILQQNVKGQTVSLYRFLPDIIMQANSTVTVWSAASEAKHQPPSDFLWKEQNKFRTSPDCTTILCKPNGEAVAWYTPIHWKQAWEKLETDIEFDRSSVVTPTFQRHVFQRTTSATSITKEKQDQPKKDASKFQKEQPEVFLTRGKEIPPTLFPIRSPWCQSPCVPAHPYCSLIEPYNTCPAGSSCVDSPGLSHPGPFRPQGPRKRGHLSHKRNRQSTLPLKDNNIQV